MTMAMAETETHKGFIDVRDMGVTFGANDNKVVAVENVSLNVQPGEFVSLIGPSGCGKSTLLSIVAGFAKPTLGEARLDGKAITKPGSDRGVVFQQYSLFPWLSVRKNVEFGLKMAGVEQSKRNTTARALLDLAGLLSFENHYPDQLSGGMKQRIGIVRALATSPQVLLMDEPFGALDTQTRVVMQEILTNIWQQFKISVLFITHDIHFPLRPHLRHDRAAGPHQGGNQGAAAASAPGRDDRHAGVHEPGAGAQGPDPGRVARGNGAGNQGSGSFRLRNESGTERSRRNLLGHV
jgi:NitT/TauT family transport system ATP-binding protein